MNRRDFLRNAGAATAGLAMGAEGVLQGAARDWNILVVTSDEHNPKIMGCAGHPMIRTPAMDRLAREGTMFTRAYCADPICAPTRQSIMTGNYPQEHGQYTNAHVFNDSVRTWGHHFKEHGYATACIGKTHTNGPDNKIGFDYRNVARDGRAKRSWDAEDKKAYDASPDTRFSGQVLDTPDQDHDGVVANDSVRWLKTERRTQVLPACVVREAALAVGRAQQFLPHVRPGEDRLPAPGPRRPGRRLGAAAGLQQLVVE